MPDDFYAHISKTAFEPGLRLPGRTHGLNRPAFLQICNGVLLAVVKFTPVQYQVLHMRGLSNADIDTALGTDVQYQPG